MIARFCLLFGEGGGEDNPGVLGDAVQHGIGGEKPFVKNGEDVRAYHRAVDTDRFITPAPADERLDRGTSFFGAVAGKT